MTGPLLVRDRRETREDPGRNGSQRRAAPGSKRSGYRKAGRIALIAVLTWLSLAALVGYVALVQLGLGDSASPDASAAPAWPDDNAKAFAARFTQALFTDSPSAEAIDARTAALRAMLSPKVDPDRAHAVLGGGRSRVLGTRPAGFHRRDARSADIVVAATVATRKGTSTSYPSRKGFRARGVSHTAWMSAP